MSQQPDHDVTATNPSLGHVPGSDHKTTSEKELDSIEETLRVTLLALEILTGVCAKLPEPDPVLEADIPGLSSFVLSVSHLMGIELVDIEMDDDVDVDPKAEGVDEAMIPERPINGTSKLSDLDRMSTNTLLLALTRPLAMLVHPTTLSFPPGPSEPSPHPPTTSAISTIHIRALECLNNLFLAVEEAQGDESTISPEYKESVKVLWNELWRALAEVGKVVKDGKVIASRGLEKKMEMWEIAVGVLWGIARICRGQLVGVISILFLSQFKNSIQVPDAEQVQALIEFCDATTDDMTKVKCIGTLECLAQNIDTIDANKVLSIIDDFISRD